MLVEFLYTSRGRRCRKQNPLSQEAMGEQLKSGWEIAGVLSVGERSWKSILSIALEDPPMTEQPLTAEQEAEAQRLAALILAKAQEESLRLARLLVAKA